MVRIGCDDADAAMEEERTSDEEEYAPNDEDEGGDEDDLIAELDDLLKEDGDIEENSTIVISTTRESSRRSTKGLGLLLTDKDGQILSREYENPLLDMYHEDEPQLSQPRRSAKKRTQSTMGHEEVHGGPKDSSVSPQRANRCTSAGSNKSVHFEDEEPETPATIRKFEDSDQEDDEDFEPADLMESDKENAGPELLDVDHHSLDDSDSSSSTSSENSSSDNESDETSSSGSSSDSSSDSDTDSNSTNGQTRGPSQTSSSTSSSSTGNSKATPSRAKEHNKPASKKHVIQQWAKNNVTLTTNVEDVHAAVNDDLETPSPTQNLVSPGQGKSATHARNKRRRESKKMALIKSQGILPKTATKADLRKYLMDNKKNEGFNDQVEQAPPHSESEEKVAFEAKRQVLLESLDKGGVDITLTETGSHSKVDGRTHSSEFMLDPSLRASVNRELLSQEPLNTGNALMIAEASDMSQHSPSAAPGLTGIHAQEPDEASKDNPAETVKESPASASQQRRSRVDLSSAKRMLFGSLGLRTPKTKADESLLRNKLLEDIRPVKQTQPKEQVEIVDEVAAAAADESWKDKIDLRAVECCHEGVVLSTPPFPFVQRWDPQQQGGYNYADGKKRKGKKRKRNNDEYYDHAYDQNELSYESSMKDAAAEARQDDVDLQQEARGMNDDSFQDSLAVSDQLLREAHGISPDTLKSSPDLPAIPEDPTTCPALTPDKARVGTVIAFKQFQMGEETNWQPIISEFLTAVVDDVREDGTLQVTPAKRDRPAKEIRYNDRTGERLLGKFDMPGYSGDEDEDNSKMELSFATLISPIIVRDSEERRPEAGNDQTNPEAHGQDKNAQSLLNGKSPQTFLHAFIDKLAKGVSHPISGQHGLDGAKDNSSNSAADVPTEADRADISQMIRDAGRQSGLGPELSQELQIASEGQGPEQIYINGNIDGMYSSPAEISSPKFHGFDSIPLNGDVQVESSPIPSQPRDTKHSLASGTGIAETMPLVNHPESPTRSTDSLSKASIEYPELPQVADDSNLIHQEAQDRSELLEQDHNSLSQDLTLNGLDQSPAQSTRSHTRPSQSHGQSSPLFKAPDPILSSDDDSPPLFSQEWDRRMSQEPRLSQTQDVKSELFSSQEAKFSISPPACRQKSKSIGNRASSQRETNQSWLPEKSEMIESDRKDDTMAKPSQAVSSKIVDLTLSSDSIEPSDSPYVADDDGGVDSPYLPSGSGWVRKKGMGFSSSAPAKANTGRRKTKNR